MRSLLFAAHFSTMNIDELPFEIVSAILKEVVESNIRDGPMYTFGLTQPPQPFRKSSVQRYVKAPFRPETLRWDATSDIRRVCREWHEWATGYALRSVSVSRFKGGEVSILTSTSSRMSF